MIDFIMGRYKDKNHKAYKYMQELDDAFYNRNILKIVRLVPKYRKMKALLEKDRKDSLPSPSEELINVPDIVFTGKDEEVRK